MQRWQSGGHGYNCDQRTFCAPGAVSERTSAAAEAQSLGRGGILAVAGATGVARKSIARGLQELAQVTLQRADFHGEWNDTTLPRPKPTDTLIL
jgi:ABC-type sugar transport system ATPase subunit